MNKIIKAIVLFTIPLFTANANALDFNEKLKQIAQRFETLQSEEITVSEDERGTVLTLSSQLFAVGKSELTDELKENLKEVTATLAEYPDADVEIEGHSDSTGSAKVNQELSEKRAKNVMDFLIEQGISKKRLSAVGYGKDRPIADNGTEEGRAANRRVEKVMKKKEKEKQPTTEEKEGIRFGIRGGINGLQFSPGKLLEKEVGMEMAFGVGLVVNIPLTSQLRFNPELALYYRDIFSYDEEVKVEMSEGAISIPVLLHFTPLENGSLYLAAGIQADIPFSTDMTLNEKTITDYTDHRTIDFGIALGFGYSINPNWKMDFRAVIGMTGLFEDFDGYEDKTSLMQFGAGMTYFF
jgi:outer membrane protein OmpA-like peptidoglycan-associated protein